MYYYIFCWTYINYDISVKSNVKAINYVQKYNLRGCIGLKDLTWGREFVREF